MTVCLIHGENPTQSQLLAHNANVCGRREDDKVVTFVEREALDGLARGFLTVNKDRSVLACWLAMEAMTSSWPHASFMHGPTEHVQWKRDGFVCAFK